MEDDYYSCFLTFFRITPRKFDMVPALQPQSDLGSSSSLTLSKRGTRTSFTFRKIRHEPCRCGEMVVYTEYHISTIIRVLSTVLQSKFLIVFIVLFGEIYLLRASCSQNPLTCIKIHEHIQCWVKVFSPCGIFAALQAKIKMEFLRICIIGSAHCLRVW